MPDTEFNERISQLTIDPEFKDLIPPLTAEEYNTLEQSIMAEGCRDAIVLWNNVIVDGHNRYAICKKHGIPFNTVQKEFPSRNDAIIWIIKNQFGRRNLPAYERGRLALRLEPLIAEKAKKQQVRTAENRAFTILNKQTANAKRETTHPVSASHEAFSKENSPDRAPDSHQGLQEAAKAKNLVLQNSVKQAIDTREAIAEAAGVSHDTIAKIKKLEAKATDEMKQRLRSGDISINNAYLQIKRQETEERREAERKENATKIETLSTPLEAQGLFQTIVIDPPWDWGDEGDVNQFGRAMPDYHTMPIEDIKALPVGKIADVNCHLYLWVTNRSLPKAFELMEAWGFRYITCLTWVKPSIGMGNYFRGSTEQILFGVKGKQPLKRHDVGTSFTAPRGDRHSAKPDEFYRLVESCSYGPYIDIFGRKGRGGWSVWGENG